MHGSVDLPLLAACLCDSAEMMAFPISHASHPFSPTGVEHGIWRKRNMEHLLPSFHFLLVRPGMMRRK